MLGRMASLPASPPSPPAVCSAAGMLAPFENFVDGLINEPAIAKCLPEPSRAIPAGFPQTVVASSATAAAPAYAFPNPLTPCSYRAKAAACASEPASRPSADTTAPAIALRFIFFSPSENIYVTNFLVPYGFTGAAWGNCRSATNHFGIGQRRSSGMFDHRWFPIKH